MPGLGAADSRGSGMADFFGTGPVAHHYCLPQDNFLPQGDLACRGRSLLPDPPSTNTAFPLFLSKKAFNIVKPPASPLRPSTPADQPYLAR